MEKLTLPQNVIFLTLSEAQALNPELKVNVGDLGRIKPGDWIRLLLRFPMTEQVNGSETITCLVRSVNRDTEIIRCRVISNPEQASRHSLAYGDDIMVHSRYVFEHTLSPAGEAERTAHLLEDQKPLGQHEPLVPGKQYWTRSGAVAVIWHATQDGFLLGEVKPTPTQAELREVPWKSDGSHRYGNRDLDIVRDPSSKVQEVPN
jgi:hypothetical protein